ncbi:DUF4058 family protein [Leptothoe sp. EHU-05/26/07-4]
MASPFPGMDPYLEHPEMWPGVHLLMIAALAESLAPQLRPKYSVSVEVRMYEITLVEVPMPITVRQGYLEVREVATKEVVTAIDLLSPINKRPGRGRQTYENKRERVLSSSTNLVEIDLLRAYEPMPVLGDGLHSHYRVLVSRSDLRPQAEIYKFNVTDQVPSFQLPLRPDDQAPIVDLQRLLDEIYERSGYDLKLDYQQDPVPSVSDDEAAWLDSLLCEQGLRSLS